MRARSIKPGICDNEVLGTADPFYTLLFERLWMIADREGRLEDRPLRIKAQAFPYRDGLDVEPMLAWLAEHEFIARYQVGANRYIQILKFATHQRPHANEQASVIPSMPEGGTTKAVPEHNQGSAMDALTPSSLTPDSLPPDSGLLTPDTLRVSSMSPEGAMAVELRKRDVSVTSMHPTLVAWVKDGFTVDQVCEAVEVARKAPGKESGSIAANYLDRILRSPARAPPASQPLRGKTAWDRMMEANGGD